MSRPRRSFVDNIAAVILLVVAWDLYTRFGGVPPYLLPSPSAVGAALANLAITGELWPNLSFTVRNLLGGFALGAGAGMAAGFALGAAPRIEAWLERPILILQTAPKIALAPLFVIWFGLGTSSKIALIISLVFFPVMVGTLVGARSVDPRLRDLAKVLRLSTIERIRRIELPSAMPEIFVGLRIGAVQAVVGAIVAEWMSGSVGLGFLMTFAAGTYRTPLLFAAVVLTVALGLAAHIAVGATERRVLAWKRAGAEG